MYPEAGLERSANVAKGRWRNSTFHERGFPRTSTFLNSKSSLINIAALLYVKLYNSAGQGLTMVKKNKDNEEKARLEREKSRAVFGRPGAGRKTTFADKTRYKRNKSITNDA